MCLQDLVCPNVKGIVTGKHTSHVTAAVKLHVYNMLQHELLITCLVQCADLLV